MTTLDAPPNASPPWTPTSNDDWLTLLDDARRKQWIDQTSWSAIERQTKPLPPGRAPHQHPPTDPWTTWLLLGGRGAGKTLAGAAWIAAQTKTVGRLALIGPTFHDVREVMIEGPSGIKSLYLSGERPAWQATRRRLVFRNGAVAQAFSAEDPDSLRGPQFHAAWADEFCAWPKPAETLAMLRFGLRLGQDPRLVVTTTPRPIRALRTLIAEPGVVQTRAATAANADHLAPAFLATLRGLYGGTRLAAQELDGLIVEGEGGLFRAEDLARCRGAPPAAFERVVVAIDPPATAGGDACGIVVCGRFEGRAFVLADLTARGLSPHGWARRAVEAAVRFAAAAPVAAANQGGDMVRAVLAQAAPPCPITLVKASQGKRARAEPVAALYEQGRVVHCGPFPALEEELMALGSNALDHSPDRADALVWALSALMLGVGRRPRLSVL